MYYTLKYKRVLCPLWKDEVTITAKYRYTDDPDSYTARFIMASCEIQENLRLPAHKRNKRLALYGYCDNAVLGPCLHDFPAEIDFRTDS